MRLLSVRASGFRSFRDAVAVEFPDRRGLFLVRGANLDEPDLGANGAGKSTLWDAVCWALYGKTSRGLSGPDVESWGRAETSVLVELEVAGRCREVLRTRAPISLRLDGREVEQSAVDDLLGLSLDQHLHVCLLGQFGALFPDLPPRDRLDLLSRTLGLDRWTAAADRASAEARELASRVAVLGTAAAAAAARGAALSESLGVQEGLSLAWARGLARQSEEAEKSVLAAKTAAEWAAAEEQSAVAAEASARSVAEVVAARSRAWERERSRLSADLRTAEARLRELERETCPTCRRPFDGAELDEVRGVGRASVRSLRDDLRKLGEDPAAGLSGTTSVAVATAELTRSRSARMRADLELAAAERALRVVRGGADPHAGEVDRLIKELGAVERAEEEAVVEMADAETRRCFAEDWARLFRELRLWVVDGVLVELEATVRSALAELGLRGWAVIFRVDRQTKSGTVVRGFGMAVRSPASPDEVPWESWSGGETQRLRLACAAGFASALRSRVPDAPEWEVWDEPSRHLNEEGVGAVARFLDARAASRQVWLVDHRVADGGRFDGSLLVEKEDGASRVVASWSASR